MSGSPAPETGSILAVVGLFALGVLSPGPNFLVVAQSSLSRGRGAGLATGLGVALGDALYASAALLGVESSLTRGGPIVVLIRVVGGLYLIGLGVGMMTRRSGPLRVLPATRSRATDLGRCFLRGLLTDLSNPKTILFFASIFAIAYEPGPAWVALVTLGSIVGFSVAYRAGLSYCLSRAPVRDLYEKLGAPVSRVCGALLAGIGLRLILQG